MQGLVFSRGRPARAISRRGAPAFGCARLLGRTFYRWRSVRVPYKWGATYLMVGSNPPSSFSLPPTVLMMSDGSTPTRRCYSGANYVLWPPTCFHEQNQYNLSVVQRTGVSCPVSWSAAVRETPVKAQIQQALPFSSTSRSFRHECSSYSGSAVRLRRSQSDDK